MKNKIKSEFKSFKLLLISIPSPILAIFIMAFIAMNLLANKSVNMPFSFMAIDCGIIVSWVVFLVNDIITKHFGPKAATQISVFAILVNLFVCLIFFICAKIPGIWAQGIDNDEINNALDNLFGGTWYVLLGSTIAFFVSAVVNNLTNYGLGLMLHKNPDSFKVYAIRSYVSTSIGQFVDNFCFAFLVSHFFFGWTLVQCVVCSLTGMVLELVFEIIFSPLGYKVCNKMKESNIGYEYIKFEMGDTYEGINNWD